jgi:hypothetical protein
MKPYRGQKTYTLPFDCDPRYSSRGEVSPWDLLRNGFFRYQWKPEPIDDGWEDYLIDELRDIRHCRELAEKVRRSRSTLQKIIDWGKTGKWN